LEPGANELLAGVRRGERAAAAGFIELFYERIYAFLRRLTGNEADAADLTQRTFTRVWQRLDSFAGRASVGSWMHSIAYHAYVDWRRAESRVEARPEEWWVARESAAPQPDEIAARNDLAAKLYRSVDNLSPDLKEAVHLHYYQELSLQETADALGVATSTVKYRLRQALSELEKNLNREPVLLNSPARTGKI